MTRMLSVLGSVIAAALFIAATPGHAFKENIVALMNIGLWGILTVESCDKLTHDLC